MTAELLISALAEPCYRFRVAAIASERVAET
jgi:hypothetical protein